MGQANKEGGMKGGVKDNIRGEARKEEGENRTNAMLSHSTE
jgi:hypothetical protein